MENLFSAISINTKPSDPVSQSGGDVSVIIPVYNVERYLGQCLESITRQSMFSSLEVIIINDGSTDGGGELARAYADTHPNVRLFETENRGLGPARNLGLENASGSYVIFLDSDDRLPPNACEAFVNAIRESGADIVAGQSVWRDANGVDTPVEYLKCWYSESYLGKNLRRCPEFALGFPIATSKIFNRQFLVEHDLTFPNIYGEDTPFSLMAFERATDIRVISDVIYWRTDRDDPENPSIMQTYTLRTVTDRIEGIRMMLEFVESSSLPKQIIEEVLQGVKFMVSAARKIPDARDADAAIAALAEFLYTNITHSERKRVVDPCLEDSDGAANMFRLLPPIGRSHADAAEPTHPLVSVVIPTHGRPGYLSRVVESCLNQTYSPIEVIVVDDNAPESTDRSLTGEVMAKFSSQGNVIYLQPATPKNASVARNAGVKVAQGEYIALLDDDDVFHTSKIERQVQLIHATDDDVRAVYCGKDSEGGTREFEYLEGDLSREILFHNTDVPLCSSTLLIEKSAYMELDGFDDAFPRHQDYEFMLRYFEQNRIACIPEVLVDVINDSWSPPSIDKILVAKQLLFDRFPHVLERFSDRVATAMTFTHLQGLMTYVAATNSSQVASAVFDAVLNSPSYRKLHTPLISWVNQCHPAIYSTLPFANLAAIQGVIREDQKAKLEAKTKKLQDVKAKLKEEKIRVKSLERTVKATGVGKVLSASGSWVFVREYLRSFSRIRKVWKSN